MIVPKRIEFTFDDAPLTALDGQSVAAALTAAGVREFRRTAAGNPRGMFCGMGVCQDCLVEINGEPNLLACAAKVQPGIKVRTQTAAPSPIAFVQPAQMPGLESERPDVLVVGAGPAGLAAAEAAAQNGTDVLLLDERRTAGGQFYKQTDPALDQSALDRQQQDGAKMIAKTSLSGAKTIANATIWGAFEGPLLCAEVDGAPLEVRPKAVVVATGAYERPLMVPGWDLPGVMTTGAAQTLWRCYRVVPGRRIAIAGNGPLNFQVALELSRAGCDIVVVAEAAPPPHSRPAAAAAMLSSDPGLTWEGMKTVAALSARGIPIRYGAALERIEKADGLLFATIALRGRRERLEVDSVCMNYGFHPQNEILRLLGARFEFDGARQQLVPSRNEHFETSIRTVFAIGDCCGTMGAPASVEEGRIAGAAAAARAAGRDLERSDDGRLARIRRFQKALWTLFSARGQEFADIRADALVCRCEEIAKSRIDKAATEDGFGIGSVKRTTRMGMGRCQGRYCMHAVAPHLAREQGVSMDEFAFFAPRPPVKPVSIFAVAVNRMAAGFMEPEL